MFNIKVILLVVFFVFITVLVVFFRRSGVNLNKTGNLKNEANIVALQIAGKSPVIKSIKLVGDSQGRPITIENSYGDLWFSTWADDDNIYTTWGDGRGFGNILSDVGVARLEGLLPNLQGKIVYYEKHPGILRLGDNDKPSSLLFLNGRLYGHFFSPLANPRIGYTVYSDNYGKTWTRVGYYTNEKDKPQDVSPWTSENNSFFRCLSFLNMGKNYEQNRDGYIYGYGVPKPGRWNEGVYLTRVKKEEILNYGAYEYLVETVKGEPIWSKKQLEVNPLPGLKTPGQVSVIYHPGVGRYLLLTSEDLFDAPAPWGLWTHVGTWNNLQDGWGGGYQPGIVSKGLGEDSFWFTISGQPKKGAEVPYKLNLGKMIMKLY